MVRKNAIGMMVATLLSLVFAAVAAGSVGTLTQVTGAVAIIPSGQGPQVAAVGATVAEGDTLLTRAKSQAEITFADGSIMRMASNSRVRVTQYESAAASSKSVFTLFEGKVQNIVLRAVGFFNKNNDNRYEVHTPTAVCGVRGTEFFVSFIEGISQSAVKSGVVYAYSANQPDEVREVKAGQSMVVVSADKPPVVRPALTEDLILEDDKGPPAAGDTPADEGPPPPDGNTPGDDGNKVSDGGTIDTPPSPSTETATRFSADMTGVFAGTLSGSIGNESGKGTFAVNATYTGGETAAQRADGRMDTGGGFVGYIGGTQGSWEGLYTGIWVDGGARAGYVYSLLPGTLSGGALTAEGPAWRSKTLGSAGSQADISGTLATLLDRLPELASLGTGGGGTSGKMITGVDTTGMASGRQRILSAWTLQTGGGTVDPSLLGTGFGTLYAEKGASHYVMGYVDGSDDGAGHVALSAAGDVPLTYIDSDYLGALSLWYRGTHDGDGTNYRSTGQGTATLDLMGYGGQWSAAAGTLYTSNGGSFGVAGEDAGLFGGFSAPWDSTAVDFFAMGDYTYSGGAPATSYLLSSLLQGWGVKAQGDHDGNLTGFTNGLWKTDGTFAGYGALLTLAPDGRAGVMAGHLTGNWFDGAGMWSASGTLASTFKENLTQAYTISPQWMAASGLSGAFFGAGETGDTAGIITGGLDELSMFISLWDYESPATGWGIYTFRLGDGNTFQRPGDGTYTGWSAKLGGRTYKSDGYGDPMFFSADLTGTWTEAGQITGDLSGIYQSATHRGTFSGPVFGQDTGTGTPPVEAGTWIASSVGTFDGQKLAWGGFIEQGLGYTGLDRNTGGFAEPDGSINAAIGSFGAPWTEASVTDFLTLGTVENLASPQDVHLFGISISGSDQWPLPELLHDRRMIEGFGLGLWQPGGTIADVAAYGLFMAGNGITDGGGRGGLIRSWADGWWDQTLGVWQLDGDWGAAPYGFSADTGVVDIFGQPGSFVGGKLYQEFDTGFSVSAGVGTSLAFNLGYVPSGGELFETQPMGAFSLVLAEGAFSRESGQGSVPVVMGGPNRFGAYWDEDNGYWRAESTLLWTDEGVITGFIHKGYYLSKTHFGRLYGDVAGLADPGDNGTWYAQAVGVWEGERLDYSGDWGGATLYYNNAGDIAPAGADPGIFGMAANADGGYDLRAMGTFTDGGYGDLSPGFGGPYVLSTPFAGTAVTSVNDAPGTGLVGGHAAAIWMKPEAAEYRGVIMPGYAAAILAAPDNSVSLLTGGLDGVFWETEATRAEGLWETGAALNAVVMPVPEGYSASDASLVSLPGIGQGATGLFDGSMESRIFGDVSWMQTQTIAYGGISQVSSVTPMVAGVSGSLPYGVLAYHIGGTGTGFVGKPAGDALSSFMAGGEAAFGTGSGDQGYWIADGASSWTGYGDGTGIIDGLVHGRYLSRTHLGVMEGALFGLYREEGWDEATGGYAGDWVGAGAGVYEAQIPLDYSGYWGGDTLYRNDAGDPAFAGTNPGLFGLVRLDAGDMGLYAMGTFSRGGTDDLPLLWHTALEGAEVGDDSGMSAVGGFASGLWLAPEGGAFQGAMPGSAAALVLDTDGSVNLLTAGGGVYGDVFFTQADALAGLWTAEATMVSVAVPATAGYTGVDAAIMGASSLSIGQLAGSFGGGDGNTLFGTVTAFDTRFVAFTDSALEETVSLPYGVYRLTIGGGAAFAQKPAAGGESLSYLGGRAQFGSRPQDAGYWIAGNFMDWADTSTAGGAISGDMEGLYITRTHLGALYGSMDGLYQIDGGDEGGDFGTWAAAGVGAFVAERTLDISGVWGTGTIYDNAGGQLIFAGEATGLFGVSGTDAGYELMALGAFSDAGSGSGGPYLWHTPLDGAPVSGSGAVGGFSAGALYDGDFFFGYGEMVGDLDMVLFTTGEAPSVSLGHGYALGERLATDATGASGNWLLFGEMDKTPMPLPEGFDPVTAFIDGAAMGGGSIMGRFVDTEDTSISGEILMLETRFVAYRTGSEMTVSLPFGVYSLDIGAGMSGTGYQERPASDAEWKAVMGGMGRFGARLEDQGYWQAGIDGTWEAFDSGKGIISGQLNGMYLTGTHFGEMAGDVWGLYDDEGFSGSGNYGSWVGVNVGAYEGKIALTYSGSVGGPQANLIGEDYGSIGSAGDLQGLLGVYDQGLDGVTGIVGMGMFDEYGYGAPYLWSMSLTAAAANDPGGAGGVTGYSGGLWLDGLAGDGQGWMDLFGAAVIYGADGAVGLAQGPMYGEHFTTAKGESGTSGNWFIDQSMPVTDMAALVPETYDIGTARSGEAFIDSGTALKGRFDGTFDDSVWRYGFAATSRFVNFDDDGLGQTVSLPFGVYNIDLGGGNYFEGKGLEEEGWSAVLGGHGAFGVRGSDSGYWLADIASTWRADGTIDGLLTGTYQTLTHRGTMTGPFWGLYEAVAAGELGMEGPWAGLSVGTYLPDQPLDFSADWGAGGTQQGMFLWDPYYSAAGGVYGGFFDVADTRGVVGGVENDDGSLSLWAMGDFELTTGYTGDRYLWASWSEGTDTAPVAMPGLFGMAAVGRVIDNAIGGAAVVIRADSDGASPRLYTGSALAGWTYPMNDVWMESFGFGYWQSDATLQPGMGGLSGRIAEGQMLSQDGFFGERTGSIVLTDLAWETVRIAAVEGPDEPWQASAVAFEGTAGGFGTAADTPWQLSATIEDADTRQFVQIAGSQWDKLSPGAPGNQFEGEVSGAWVHWDGAITGVSGGHLKGMFDPADAATWVAAAVVMGMDTEAFAATLKNGATDVLAAMNIAYWSVGVDNLSGTDGGNLEVFMDQVGFFATTSGAAPALWATDTVYGSFNEIPAVGDALSLTGAAVAADFVVHNWDADHWGAIIGNGSGVVGGHNIAFSGAAAGPVGSVPGSVIGFEGSYANPFGGTAAGVASVAGAE